MQAPNYTYETQSLSSSALIGTERAPENETFSESMKRLISERNADGLSDNDFRALLFRGFCAIHEDKRWGRREHEMFAEFQELVEGKPRDMQLLLSAMEPLLNKLLMHNHISHGQFESITGKNDVDAFLQCFDTITNFNSFIKTLPSRSFHGSAEQIWDTVRDFALEEDARPRARIANEFLQKSSLLRSIYYPTMLDRSTLPDFPDDTSLGSLNSALAAINTVADVFRANIEDPEKREVINAEDIAADPGHKPFSLDRLDTIADALFPERVIPRMTEKTSAAIFAVLKS